MASLSLRCNRIKELPKTRGGRTQRVCEVRLVFIGDCNNICRRQRGSPLKPGARARGMEDGIIRTLPCSLVRPPVLFCLLRERTRRFIVTPHLEKADSSAPEDKRSHLAASPGAVPHAAIQHNVSRGFIQVCVHLSNRVDRARGEYHLSEARLTALPLSLSHCPRKVKDSFRLLLTGGPR